LIPVETGCHEPGTVVLFRWRPYCPAKHAAILLSDDRMIHAQNGSAVTVATLSDWWKRRIAYAFQFPKSQRASSPVKDLQP
jgi:NlpC/P60 family putative phage cell wall peptidase